ncbi:MAG: O-methyltransferase [Candidatus Poribacteria bacterium]|nr:O-methyltransferase [Candidatus Poribacteria bacterium]
MNLHMLDSSINDHLHQVIPERDEVLTEMEAYAKERRFPIVGPLVGRVLHQLVLITNPTRIFEMGSGFGYSAYWMAKALRDESAKIICTEGSQDNADRAMGYFQRGGIANRIEYRVGDALEIIDETTGTFDIIYNDIDKDGYPQAFRKAIPRLRHGGLFITDNMFLRGRVTTDDTDSRILGVQELTRLLYESDGIFTTIIPLRDGVSVAVKL